MANSMEYQRGYLIVPNSPFPYRIAAQACSNYWRLVYLKSESRVKCLQPVETASSGRGSESAFRELVFRNDSHIQSRDHRERLLYVSNQPAALDRVIDGFLGNAEFAHPLVAQVPELLDPRGAGVIRIHRHAAGPSEEADAGSQLRLAVAAVGDFVEHRRLQRR